MKRLKVHVLYEYGVNYRPHASASLRLLRPLSYPTIREAVDVTFGYDFDIPEADLVLVDRLWRPDIQPEMADQLAEAVHQRGARLIYWFDDHFPALSSVKSLPAHLLESFEHFLNASDGCVVSTTQLQAEFSGKAPVVFIPSALDERIIVQKQPQQKKDDRLVIGYMGSSTHDEDLELILPALSAVNDRFPGRLEFQVVGAVDQEKADAWPALNCLPLKILQPLPEENEYPLFMLWFTGTTRWDFAVAPLVDNQFNHFKSDIKFLDYTAAGTPGIFSAVASYSATIQDHEMGLLSENSPDDWVDRMVELIEDAQLRQNLLEHASMYLYQHRTLSRCAGNWVKALTEMKG